LTSFCGYQHRNWVTAMTTIVRANPIAIRWPLAAWLPLAVLPVMTALLTTAAPSWVRMWALAISIYGSLIWLTFAASAAAWNTTLARSAGYLLLWTGMDAEAFFRKATTPVRTQWSAWLWAVGQ